MAIRTVAHAMLLRVSNLLADSMLPLGFKDYLKFRITGKAARRTKDGASTTEYTYLDLDDCPDHLVNIARWRLWVIQPLLEMEERARTRQDVKNRVQAVKAEIPTDGRRTLAQIVSVTSAYLWMRLYLQGNEDLRALIPDTQERGGKGQPRIGCDLDATITKVIKDLWYRRERQTIDMIYQMVAAELAEEDQHLPEDQRRKPPGRTTVFRRLDDLDMQDVIAQRHGKNAARKRQKQNDRTEYPEFPLERVEIDHTRTDLIVIDDLDNLPLGRLTLTYCLDMATRYPLGLYMGFEPPGYYAVAACLHHAICVKESVRELYGTEHDWQASGIPGVLVVDNGREFIGDDLRDAAELLGFIIQVCPVATPQFKSGIERAIRTMTEGLFHTLPGTTFSSPVHRGDYNSTREACIYLSEVDKVMSHYLVDVYAESQHKGLGGIPARAWERHIHQGFMPRLPASADELTILLGQTEYRRVWHYGIDVDNLRYKHEDLGLLRTRLKEDKVKIKRYPGDLSRIYVHDPSDNRYIEVPVEPCAQEYAQNLSLWKHKVISEFVRATGDKVDIAALGRARKRIQEIVDASRERHKVNTRTRIARWETSGKSTRELAAESQQPASADTPSVSTESAPELPAPPERPARSAIPDTIDQDGWEIAPMPQSRQESSTDTRPHKEDV
jgi:putative transposase